MTDTTPPPASPNDYGAPPQVPDEEDIFGEDGGQYGATEPWPTPPPTSVDAVAEFTVPIEIARPRLAPNSKTGQSLPRNGLLPDREALPR